MQAEGGPGVWKWHQCCPPLRLPSAAGHLLKKQAQEIIRPYDPGKRGCTFAFKIVLPLEGAGHTQVSPF